MNLAEVVVGLELPAQEFIITRADLIRYAGASGDFNVIHWNERVAREVGLPNVIAHGMFTMGLAIRVVTDWIGDPAAIVEYSCRFTRPVPVPDDTTGTVLGVSATVTEILETNRAVITLTAKNEGVTVLGKARAVVTLPA